MVYKKSREDIDKDTNETKRLIVERGHIFISGEYTNRQAKLVVYCPFHKKLVPTTFHNYDRSRTGLQCCGRQQSSDKLLNRQFSPETIEKMRVSALNRPLRGGKPRKWRSQPLRAYKPKVYKLLVAAKKET